MQSVYIQDKPNYFKKFLVIFGNLLVILSLFGFAYIFSPFLFIYLTPPVVQNLNHTKGYFITIPKIKAQAPIITNVNPWNETEYQAALKKGVAQAQKTALPLEAGTTFLFAHSSGYPWELTRFNTVFLKLSELEIKDKIVITKDGVDTVYIVWMKKEVWPNEVNYLVDAVHDNADHNQLIIQTCTPVGTAFKRLLVFAAPQ